MALVQNRKKVLVVGLDSQSNPTGLLKEANVKVEKCITDLFEIVRSDNQYPHTSEFIYTSVDGVDFIGGNNLLGNTEISLAMEMCQIN